MADELTRFFETPIPQTEKADNRQVQNSAGGFSFKVTPETKFERFLILGTEGGTYYIQERDLTKQNLDNLTSLIRVKPDYVLETTKEISASGRAYRNNTAIFTLAYMLTIGSDASKSKARGIVNDVVRTSTHLFLFERYLKTLAPGSGFGTSRNRAIASWYNAKTAEQLAYQAVKYRQREGWTHRDSMRRARPMGVDEYVAKWILGKADVENDPLPSVIVGFEALQAEFGSYGASTEQGKKSAVLEILDTYNNLPWEALPTEAHKWPEVWKKLFYNGQLQGQALLRNITRLARLGAFNDVVFARDYANKLNDEAMIKRTKLHPMQYLNALVVYTEGQAHRDKHLSWASSFRQKDWVASPIIVDALNDGFHKAFAYVEPSNKRTLLGLDVSGSMSGAMALGLDLSAAQVSGTMAATIAKREPYHMIMGFANKFKDLGITANMDLKTVMRKVQDQNFGSTDCALPMTWARDNKLEFDTFVVITDNETWAGRNGHPHTALKDYRQKMGIDARLIVVGVCANEFTIAVPSDSGMLDVAGADSNLPKLITEFSAGRI